MPRETLASLRAERDALLGEVARLRAAQAAHVCSPLPNTKFEIPAGAFQIHHAAPINACAGNHATQTLTFPNTAGGNYPTYQLPPSAFIGGAAGGGVAQQVWFNVGGECG